MTGKGNAVLASIFKNGFVMSTFETLAKASSMGHWALNGRQQLVKVVSASGRDYLMNKSEAERFGGGYITEKRYLWGLNNRQIEQVLGLRPMN
ncbi:hypothetical protein [Falsihalocynthiibacter arcticus]|nr:hypothetical protein [Falsihalocynthiibacter arcticus]